MSTAIRANDRTLGKTMVSQAEKKINESEAGDLPTGDRKETVVQDYRFLYPVSQATNLYV